MMRLRLRLGMSLGAVACLGWVMLRAPEIRSELWWPLGGAVGLVLIAVAEMVRARRRG
jgi:hypothetical protein